MNEENSSPIGDTMKRLLLSVVRNNFWRKAGALFFAILIYLSIDSQIGMEELIPNVPVEIDLPSGLTNLSTARVSLIVTGGRRQLREINRSKIKIKGKILQSAYEPGQPYTLRITKNDVEMPFGISVSKIEPQDLQLNVEPLISKKVPVSVGSKFNRNIGDYVVSGIKFTPEDVMITGPESIVGKIDFVEVRNVPISPDINESFEFAAELKEPGNVTLSVNKVNGLVQIDRKLDKRVFRMVPLKIIQSVGNNKNFIVKSVQPDNLTVTVSGLAGELNSASPEIVNAFIDVNNLAEGEYQVEARCQLKDDHNFTVQSITPGKVQVVIEKRTAIKEK